MADAPAAARVGDPVTHSAALWGLLDGALLGAALGAILVASGGTAAPLLIAGAAATGASIGGAVGKLWGSTQVVPTGQILTGSPDVSVNGKPAAFVSSLVACSQQPGPQTVVEGSGTVEINGRRAARVGDRCSCGCVIAPAGSPDVFTGGPAAMPAGAAASEVPWYADAALFALGLAGGGALLRVGGLGAAAIAAKLGGSLVGSEVGGAGGRALGGAIYGEGTRGQAVLGMAGALVGGMGGDLAGGRLAGGAVVDAETAEGAAELATNAEPPSYGTAFFGEDNYTRFYQGENVTIGGAGRPFFFMPAEDAAAVRNAGDAARYTGMAPSAQRAYMERGTVYGISFPTEGMEMRPPTAADAGGWPHFLEGGQTAVRLPGESGGYLLNPTREFVVPGGSPAPPGTALFELGPQGEWVPIRRF